MPRPISPRLRRSLEEVDSEELIIVFLKITHFQLKTPIRVANDVVDYMFQGETDSQKERYIGFPFEMELLTDTRQFPRANIRIQNVDRRIGQAIIDLVTPPNLEITCVASEDFADVVNNTRVELDNAIIEYYAPGLRLGDVSGDAQNIQGSILSWDLTSEPWPATRTTGDRLPGLDA